MNFWTRSLTSRLAGSFFMLMLLTVTFVSCFAFWHAYTALERSAFERLQVVSAEKTSAIDRWINTQSELVELLANAYEVRASMGALVPDAYTSATQPAYVRISTYLNAVVAEHPDLLEIFVLTDSGGRIVFSTDQEHEGIYQVDARYFQEGRQHLFVHPLYPSPILDRPAITIAAPIVDTRGTPQGVLAAHLNLERLDEIILDRTGLGETGETYLVSRYNEIVSGKQFVNQSFPRGVHTVGIDTALQGVSGSSEYPNYAGVPVLGVYQWLETQQLALLTEMHATEAAAPAHTLAGMIFLGGLVAAAVLAIGVRLLARQITHPIRMLTHSAARIAAGNLTEKVPVLTQDELGVLAQAFNQMTERLEVLYADLQQSAERFRGLIENASDIILIIDHDGIIRYESPSVGSELGHLPGTLLGHPLEQFVHPDDAPHVAAALTEGYAMPSTTLAIEFRLRHADNAWRMCESRGKYLADTPQGAGMVITARDITARQAAEAEQRRLQEEIIQIQAATLREMSTPLIPMNDYVVLMPLIGSIDSRRAHQVMETLLDGIAQHHARIAILDITGVPMVDTQVAQALIRAAQAVNLLGAQLILTGIQPQIAQTLVHLGVNLGTIMTHASLQSGIAYAFGAYTGATQRAGRNGASAGVGRSGR